MLRENMGRVFIALAGVGCLMLLFFVVLPSMNEPPPALTPGENGEEAAGPEEDAAQAEAETEGVMPAPLVAVSDDGEALPVVFPASEGENPEAVGEGEPAGAASGLPAPLSGEDVAAAAAALEGLPAGEAVEAAEESVATVPAADGTEDPEAFAEPRAGMVEPDEGASAGNAAVDAVAVEVESEAAREAAEIKMVDRLAEVVDRLTEAVEEMGTQGEAPVAFEPMGVDQVETAGKTVVLDGAGGPPIVERPLPRRGEFDVPVLSAVNSQAPLESPVPSGEALGSWVLEAGQAGGPSAGLPPQTAEVETPGVVVPDTLRGIMGYRLPLVSRQAVPDQIVSGVLIPAHTTFVILKGGSWELVDVSNEELNLLREAAARREAAATAKPEPETPAKGWTLLRMFRKQEPAAIE